MPGCPSGLRGRPGEPVGFAPARVQIPPPAPYMYKQLNSAISLTFRGIAMFHVPSRLRETFLPSENLIILPRCFPWLGSTPLTSRTFSLPNLLTAYSRILNLSSSNTFEKSRELSQDTESTEEVLSGFQRVKTFHGVDLAHET